MAFEWTGNIAFLPFKIIEYKLPVSANLLSNMFSGKD